jgi:hypothetical protein
VEKYFKKLFLSLFVRSTNGALKTDDVMEHLPTETMHGVGEKEQLKIFRKALKKLASVNRHGVWKLHEK